MITKGFMTSMVRLVPQSYIIHEVHANVLQGHVVRVAPFELSFNNAKAWSEIYGHRSGQPNMDKDPVHVSSVQRVPGASTLITANDVDHSRQRRILAPAFSQKALLEQESILQGHVGKLIRNMRNYAGDNRPADMVNWYKFTTLDIIGDLSFGEPFNCLDDGEEQRENGFFYLHVR